MYSLTDLGWNSFFEQQLTDDERTHAVAARVVWEGRGMYRLSTGNADWLAQLAGRLRHAAGSRAELPSVGDWVVTAPGTDGRATIARLLARRTRFSRAAAGRSTEEQVAAANIDTVLLVSSLNREFNLRRIERYLSLSWESGARPIIVLNKADLCSEVETCRQSAVSAGQGIPVLVTSAVRGDGIPSVREAVSQGGTTALLGSSGVGKSTLLNALVGEALQPVTAIRESDDRGRHHTTSRQLFVVPTGGVLIDTPGMRELQLWDAAEGLDHAFADVVELADDCRFRDCAHQSEPGCAVTNAVATGSLDAGRLEHYRRLQREERFVESRQDERLRLERAKQIKRLSKAAREVYRLKKR